MQCSQCSRTAVFQASGGQPLCVEHYSMLSTAIGEQQRNSMAMMNYHRDRIYETFGLPAPAARINVPQPVINQSPVFNNIKIDRSVIGAVNTAQVERIDVAMDNIRVSGDDEVSAAIKALTEAVISSTEVSDETRTQLVEQLAFLAEQAATPEAQRQQSVIKMVLKAVPATLASTASLTTLWAHWGSTLTAFF